MMLSDAGRSAKWRASSTTRPIPPRCEHGAELPVRENSDIVLHRPEPCDHAIGALAHLLRGLTVRAAVSNRSQLGNLTGYVLGPASIIVAIVPLGQIGRYFHAFLDAREFASPPCA